MHYVAILPFFGEVPNTRQIPSWRVVWALQELTACLDWPVASSAWQQGRSRVSVEKYTHKIMYAKCKFLNVLVVFYFLILILLKVVLTQTKGGKNLC